MLKITLLSPFKRIVLFILLLTGSIAIQAQSLDFQWGGNFRALSNNFDDGAQIRQAETDSIGNVYCLTSIDGLADLDPFSGTINSSGSNLALSKISPQGSLLWSIKWDSINSSYYTSLTLDRNGLPIVAGTFSGTRDFDPGSATENLSAVSSFWDGFVMKLDQNGNFIWVKQISGFTEVNDLTVGPDNHIFITGGYSGTVDFDPGNSAVNKTSNYYIAYILELDANGDFIQVDDFPLVNSSGHAQMSGTYIEIDHQSNILLTGKFSGAIDLDLSSNSAIHTTTNYWYGSFLLKIDSNRNYLWSFSEQRSSSNRGTEILISRFDKFGNIYTVGNVEDSIYLDPFSNTQIHHSSGVKDVYIRKISPSGSLIWAKVLSSDYGKEIHEIKTDQHGNLFAAGTFFRSLNFGPFHRTTTRVGNWASYPRDHFLFRLNANGNFEWVNQLVTAYSFTSETTFSIDHNDHVYSLGSVTGAPGGGTTLDLDPSPTNTFNVSIPYLIDHGYVRKLVQCVQKRSDTIVSNCGSFTWIDGITYDSSTNSPVHVIQGGASNGCDLVVSLSLTVNSSHVNTTDTVTACDQYTWINGTTYTFSTNSPSYTYPNSTSSGCDSTVRLNLTILPSKSSNQALSTCKSFTWIDGNTYTQSSNSISHTIPNGASNGCDSIINLNLFIYNVSDTTVSISGNQLTANNNNAASYQWLDCSNNYSPIPNATSQTFTASSNGSYAVKLTEGFCTDTSSCYLVSTVGLEPSVLENKIKVYPNPARNYIYMDNQGTESTSFRLLDMAGKEVLHHQKVVSGTKKYLLNELSNGVYFIELQSNATKSFHKLLIAK